MNRRVTAALTLLPFVLTLSLALATDTPFASADESDGPSAGGRLIWDASGELDLLGDLWSYVPFRVARKRWVFMGLATRTQILRPTDQFAFKLRDLEYLGELGLRTRGGPFERRPASFFIAQRGKAGVDRAGHAFVRYVGFGAETEGFRYDRTDPSGGGPRRRRVEWRAAGGPVFDEREVQGDFVVRGAARIALGARGQRRPPLFEFDVKLDGLVDDGSLLADVSAGPAIVFRVSGGKRARLFVHYQDSRNPLGLGHQGLLVGFEYSGDAGGALPAPRIDGALGGGGGEGRSAGELKLRFLSPEFGPQLRVAFVIDVNLLTAQDTRELYYLFRVGLERRLRKTIPGVWLYHRSNHQLSVPSSQITSLNVLEAGTESPTWYRTGRRPVTHRWGHVDYRAAAGLLVSSEFGEDHRWHLRGGARWALPLAPRRVAPFLSALFETGDVDRQVWAVGISPAADLDVQVEYRNDSQFFGSDHTAWLVLARYGFQ